MNREWHLSKSRFQSGRQCHKRLWLETHQRHLLEANPHSAYHFDEGNRFGELARELLGGGPTIKAGALEAERALAETKALLDQSHFAVPRIFEAAFEHEGVFVRVDALARGADHDELVEVKLSTSVKDEHLWDCAIQAWVLRGAGRDLRAIHIGHVDSNFVLEHPGDFHGILRLENVTTQVEALIPQVPGILETLKQVAAGEKPAQPTGAHCTKPFTCPFLGNCQAGEPPPPEFPISMLPQAPHLVASLVAEGYADLRDVPEYRLQSDKHLRIARASRTGKAIISPQLAESLDALAYPRYYLDFETIGPAVPRWVGTRPYQQVPFQFSCHVEHADGHMTHSEHLHLGDEAPMHAFAEALLAACGEAGPILVWNQGFEAGRTRELAAMVPEHANALHGLVKRMVDLLPLFRAHYYHPGQRGSWSIKKVLPTIAPELDYADLEVADGGMAQQAWLEAACPDTPASRRDQLQEALLRYCERDTWAMLRLARWRC